MIRYVQIFKIFTKHWFIFIRRQKSSENTSVPYLKIKFQFTDTLSFLELLKSSSNDESHEDVPYDVLKLFTSIPVQETIDYILQRIYIRKEIKPFCKKSIFTKLI